ncbi:MAG TPA: hypothetical protein VNY51_05945 [Candidatus Dormibacteraeota bacterium]|jgi:hypothetical protein|nr:hypothetical protein [Candidatus Dormibacteraeota bacterium]
METFLLSRVFRNFVFPLVGILFRVFVKRNQDPPPWKRKHFDVGLEVMCDALLMFVGLTCEKAVEWTKTMRALQSAIDPVVKAQLMIDSSVLMNKLAWAGFSIFAIFFSLDVVAMFKHDLGTVAGGNPTVDGATEGSPTILWGIAVPVLAGFVALAWVASYFSNS